MAKISLFIHDTGLNEKKNGHMDKFKTKLQKLIFIADIYLFRSIVMIYFLTNLQASKRKDILRK